MWAVGKQYRNGKGDRLFRRGQIQKCGGERVLIVGSGSTLEYSGRVKVLIYEGIIFSPETRQSTLFLQLHLPHLLLSLPSCPSSYSLTNLQLSEAMVLGNVINATYDACKYSPRLCPIITHIISSFSLFLQRATTSKLSSTMAPSSSTTSATWPGSSRPPHSSGS